MNYLLLLSNVIKTNTTCPLSGGGYSCMCDGGAIYCPSVCIEYCSCKTQCYFLACGSGGRVHPGLGRARAGSGPGREKQYDHRLLY